VWKYKYGPFPPVLLRLDSISGLLAIGHQLSKNYLAAFWVLILVALSTGAYEQLGLLRNHSAALKLFTTAVFMLLFFPEVR
jgi:hypothetical protein